MQPFAVPKQFLNRCKNIIEEGVEPASHRAKSSLRSKVEKRRSAKKQSTNARRFEADAATKKKEVFFGFLLIFAGILVLGADNIGTSILRMVQSTPEQTSDLFGDNQMHSNTAMTPLFGASSPNSAATYFGSLPGNQLMAPLFGAAPVAPEISLLDASQFGPGLMQQMVPDAGSQSGSQFHSFARKNNDLSPKLPAGAGGGYQLSNQAISGVAQQLQFSGPMMLRQGTSPIWKSNAPHAPITPNRLMQHPLMTQMIRQVHRSGYTRVLHPTHQTAAVSAPPVAGALTRFNHLSAALSPLPGNAGGDRQSDK
jgi:hypothetical protein